MYSFHGSTAAITDFWNLLFGNSSGIQVKLTRRHIWQAFVQESIRMLGANCKTNLIVADGLPIEEVTTAAYEAFGTDGVISAADNHSCSECTHAYKATADILDGEPVAMEVDDAGLVNMAVVDGVVFGPTHNTLRF
ncbi:hypothetical protein FA15DRAFT_606912 [Coprinopsis marcescibilis]|uniref:Uncharacterized protein n=1 Tax=Coprinopsis marcescibilis TaxID=230819 RepID=A0A5C3K972_COPMA|nr:hypothetical protein FA15DRAFT_606912 [Coprinopsis marcescibilis]